jgi:hypothetical protein
MSKERLRQFILEYLSPEGYKSRLYKSANLKAKKTADETGTPQVKGQLQVGRKTDDLAAKRAERVSKVKKGRGRFRLGKPTRLSKRGFDDSRQGKVRKAPRRDPSPEGGSRLGVD